MCGSTLWVGFGDGVRACWRIERGDHGCFRYPARQVLADDGADVALGLRGALGSLFVIRTRWLVAMALAVVAASAPRLVGTRRSGP